MLARNVQVWLPPGFLEILFVIGLMLLYCELRSAVRRKRNKQRGQVRFPDREDRRKAS